MYLCVLCKLNDDDDDDDIRLINFDGWLKTKADISFNAVLVLISL